jgi:glutamyl-tRNA synthetase
VYEPAAVHTAVESFAAKLSVGMGDIAQPLRVAVSGGTVTPPLEQTLAVLGKDEVLKRIDRCLASVG